MKTEFVKAGQVCNGNDTATATCYSNYILTVQCGSPFFREQMAIDSAMWFPFF